MKGSAALALVTLFVLTGQPAQAQDDNDTDPGFDARSLRDVCDPPATLDQNAKTAADRICQAYLRGVTEGLFMIGAVEQSGAPVCLPDDGPVSPAEAKSEFQDYLADHPDSLGHSAGLVVTFGIIAAHGCE